MPRSKPSTNPTIKSQELFELLQSSLQLSHGNEQPVPQTTLGLRKDNNIPLVGYLNLIHTNDVQVIGTTEADYLNQLDAIRQQATIEDCAHSTAKAFIISGGLTTAEQPWWPYFQAINKPVWTSGKLAYEIINSVNQALTQRLLPRKSLHGVFLNVLGMGVLVTGASGIGKSELALELISRGHSLVADDMVEFTREGERVIGSCPAMLQDFLEVRGLGIVNIRALFGASAIRTQRTLRLIVNLEGMPIQGLDRVAGTTSTRDILGSPVPEVTLPVTVGRNLAVLLETAVRHHLLSQEDTQYHAHEDLVTRQAAALQQQII